MEAIAHTRLLYRRTIICYFPSCPVISRLRHSTAKNKVEMFILCKMRVWLGAVFHYFVISRYRPTIWNRNMYILCKIQNGFQIPLVCFDVCNVFKFLMSMHSKTDKQRQSYKQNIIDKINDQQNCNVWVSPMYQFISDDWFLKVPTQMYIYCSK